LVVLNRIYTRTGDKGDTALGTGKRVSKYDPRIEAYGTVDETNACVGVARLHATGELDLMLARVQNDLFDLGADLCVPDDGSEIAAKALRIAQPQVDRLEREIDLMNEKLSPLRSFVLPGGSAAAAHLHVARTVCRRAERLIVKLSESEKVGDTAVKYANRLSDFLFVAARFANLAQGGDVLWVPGANRT
jgi:cob(I)alamin adenosyltransferase